MKTLLSFILVMAVSSSYGQTFEEWTQQKRTQIKYLMQQIVANGGYLEQLKKGYEIVGGGLRTIGDIKNGDFNIHSTFFSRLSAVNPKIKASTKVAQIIVLQLKIIKESKQALDKIKSLNQFTPDEINHCSDVFSKLLADCIDNIEELFMVVTDAQTSMTDDERIKRIELLHGDMQSKYGFCADYSNELRLFSIQRIAEKAEILHSEIINDLR